MGKQRTQYEEGIDRSDADEIIAALMDEGTKFRVESHDGKFWIIYMRSERIKVV